ncbi:MAG: HAD-IA family hydrolase [Phaeovulum sp.]|uniref:HAD-IA family hydrolase n=1 Tax=Phaeovulum sp. TaxID=2934796 RepID=UPI0027346E3F|nr:HAD-IA family hydrolase [Phaeovulum sp.]MDP3860070.1 HAD-IA family hydrolase [Phaeovulum sp.]
MRPRLAVFDIDGTLSDSQHHIHAAMQQAFEAQGLGAPDLAAVRQIVGLSLPIAVARLAPGADVGLVAEIVQGYKQSYFWARSAEPAPLFAGAADMLQRLAARGDIRLGIATGKSRRGLDALLAHFDLGSIFVTRQVSDNHPSKPHPAMLLAALAETGVAADDAVMIGDTTFDIEMARAAGVRGIGVRWGYHEAEQLAAAGAARLVADFAALEAVLDELLGQA